MKLLRRLQGARFFTLFNFHNELAKGRSCMLLSNAIVSVISWLTTGLFYTSFLMANGIDIVAPMDETNRLNWDHRQWGSVRLPDMKILK